MIRTFLMIFKSLFNMLKYPLAIVFGLIFVFYILVTINLIIARFKGRKLKKGTHKPLKKQGFFKRLFVDLPHRYTEDLLARDPDFFPYQGLIIFEGMQGSGKTSSMVEFAIRMQKEYPLAKCTSNLAYTKEDKPLTDWRDLITFKNGIYGVVAMLDELQNWFSSNMSRNFPPEMLQVITQNRKNRRVLLGTAQNFYLLAKPIRSQCTEVRQCLTLLGCLTIVRRRQPIVNSDGEVEKWKNKGFYFFVHSKELRESYDTYKVIEALSKSGFQERQENITNINFYESKKAK